MVRNDQVETKDIPLPRMQRCIRLAQYSFVHHSTTRLRVSLPTAPPSDSLSLEVEATEGAGDGIREGLGDGAKIPLVAGASSLPCALRSFPA